MWGYLILLHVTGYAKIWASKTTEKGKEMSQRWLKTIFVCVNNKYGELLKRR